MTTTLVKFNAAKLALREAKTIDEVKQVRDKAEALRLYAKQSGEGLEMQNDIAEIKLRAERRAGELLAEIERNLGTRTDTTSSHSVTRFARESVVFKSKGIQNLSMALLLQKKNSWRL